MNIFPNLLQRIAAGFQGNPPGIDTFRGPADCRSIRPSDGSVAPTGFRRGAGAAAVLAALTVSTGCAAVVGAALAASEIRQGLAGVHQLITGARSLDSPGIEIPQLLYAPIAGTYRGYQTLGDDTIRYYVRTAARPAAPIIDEAGNVTGYVLPGLAAASLDTLEARVRAWTGGANADVAGRTIFFIEGTQPPEPNARSLYPAAYLGRIAPGESGAADRQAAELRRLDIEMEAPAFSNLAGQGIPHELFGSVAEGIFTVRPDGGAVYNQEYEAEDGRTLIFHFERISETTLPEGG